MNWLQRSGLYMLLVVVFILPLLLAFYRPGEQTHQNEVVYWTTDTGNIGLKTEQEIVDTFNKENPDLHVRLVTMPGGETDISPLLTSVRGGTGPDVFFLGRFLTAQYAAMGLLQNLTPYMQKSQDKNLEQNYMPFAWNEVLYKKQPYALPLEADARALYYNKDVLRQAGVDPSILDPSHGPVTMDTIKHISLKVNHTNAQGSYDRIGFIPWFAEGWHTTWAIGEGAKFYNPATCQVTPTEPGLTKALQLFYNWSAITPREKIDTFLATYQPSNAPPTQNPFFSGNLGMVVNGDWFLAQLKEYAPKVHYGVTYLPVDHSGQSPYTWSGGYSLTMPKGAKNPEGAYRFMRFMTGPEGQQIYVKGTSHLPTWKSLLNDKSLYSQDHEFFVKLLPYSHGRVPLPVGALYWDELSSAQEKVTLHAATPQQALQTVYKHVQLQLQQYCSVK